MRLWQGAWIYAGEIARIVVFILAALLIVVLLMALASHIPPLRHSAGELIF